MSEGLDIIEALGHIDPAELGGYEDWLKVGMALHHEGFGYDAFGDWLRSYGVSFDERTTQAKWRSFGNGAGSPVTGGTIVKMAMDAGWRPAKKGKGLARAMALDEVLYASDEVKPILEAEMAGESDAEVKPMYGEGHGEEELKAFIGAMFAGNEHIAFTTDYMEDDKHPGKMKPSGRGTYWLTAEQVMESLDKGMVSAVGTTHDESGAWIRINPVDGEGVGNDHVTSFRYGLVESDEMDVNAFAAKVKAMNLPVAAMVYSGKRSLHAIVKVDAKDIAEYKQRMEKLYLRCEKNGIAVDRANKDASRMTRMPGVTRQGRRQYLAGLAQGAGDWEEWEAWYEESTDELPDVESMADALENTEELSPELIEGVLRVGHKMLLSGPSKAGKSFALLMLAIALAEGGQWMGFKCRRSKVLYVNLEIDHRSFKRRFADACKALEDRYGIRCTNQRSVSVWNLRGKAQPMHKLLPALVRRCAKVGAEVVIIDPIYKVMTGDENSAGDMAAFSNLFDALCDQAGVSAIYCHHHSKGAQGAKRAIDRASGSGVFGRDPDAILDMTELETDEGMRWKHANDRICRECAMAVIKHRNRRDWEALDMRTRTIESNAVQAACSLICEEEAEKLMDRCAAIRESADAKLAWRISTTLREFEGKAPTDVWFDWPLFTVDDGLKDAIEVGAEDNKPRKQRKGSRGWSKEDTEKAAQANRDKAEAEHDLIKPAILDAYNRCIEAAVEPTVGAIYDRMPDIGGLPYPVTLAKVKEWTKERNPWCPVVKTDRKASDGKSSIIALRGDAGMRG